MGKHFALTLQLPRYTSERKNRTSGVMLADRKWGAAVLFTSCLLLITYLVQVNSFATKGYEIGNLQKKIDQLKTEQRTLEVQTAELQSLQRIQAQPTILNMVPVSSISYVQNTSLSQR